MNINLTFKSLIAVVLLSGSVATNAKKTQNLAPEATASEAKLSFLDLPLLKQAFIDLAPAERDDGIPVGELGVDGGNKAMILKLAQEITENKHGPVDSLLIAHKGKLLFESYYSRGRINLPHFQASATKVYTSLALGRAIQLGYLSMADLDKPLVSFLNELDPTKFVKGVEKITLHQALTMRSGIRISDEQVEAFQKNTNQLKGQGKVQAYLEHSAPITTESQSFKYQNDPMLVMQVIEAVVPGTVEDFIKSELLDKMGITNYAWKTDISGLPKSGSSSNMTSRDMIKWGTLVINKGNWHGEQLVPEAFIAQATNRIVHHSDDDNFSDHGNISNTGYGYFWWQADMKYGNKNYFSTSARGGGGQYIILIEELDLIVVMTGWHNGDDQNLQMAAERILPAFIKDEFPIIKGPYLGQKPPGLTPELFAPGIVSTEEHVESLFTFTPDMKAFYFNRIGGEYKETTVLVMQNNNNRWSEPSVVTDTDKYTEQFSPSLAAVKNIEAFKGIPIVGFSISSKGTYYFYVLNYEDGSGHMSYSRLINGKYEKPQKMSEAINTGKWIAHPFIAPDESYLMWDAEKVDEDTPDIYISFRQQDGSWGTAINMGDKINTTAYEQRPKVTPDGKYLFFWKGDKKVKEDGSSYWVGNPYWVDAKIIETLRPHQSSVKESKTETTSDLIKKVETGLTTPVYIEGDSTWSIQERMQHYGIPGVSIAVIQNGEIAWTKGYGVVDKESKAPVTEQTLFQAAATSMPVTAYGALRLVEQNKVDLDENINSYLKSWKLPDSEFTKEKKVTLRNLLNHSAGIHPRGTGSFSINKKIPTLVEILSGTFPATNEPITVNKEPGESVSFAYASYVPIQQMMLDVEGKTFPEIMHELVLQPLEMNNSTFNQSLTKEQLAMAATGYLTDGSMVKGRRDINPAMASNGLWTTAQDYAKFITNIQQTLKGKRTKGLSKDLTELMGTPYGVSGSDWSFTLGLGFQLINRSGEIYLRHHGWNTGFYAEIMAHRDKGYGVVVMTNSTVPVFNAEVMRSVAQAYNWDNYIPIHKKMKIEQALADKITGRYLSDDATVVVFQKDKQLFYKNILDVNAEELVKVSDSNFVMRNSSRLIQFKPNSENKTINLLHLNRNDETLAATFLKMDTVQKEPVEFLLEGDFEKALKAYKALLKRDVTHPRVTEDYLNGIGYDFYHEDRMKLAQSTFKLNTVLYPDSFKVYESYAKACAKLGEINLAIINYSKSLELNPQNNYAKDKLNELQNSQ